MTDLLTLDGVFIPAPWVELFCDDGRGTGRSVLTFPKAVMKEDVVVSTDISVLSLNRSTSKVAVEGLKRSVDFSYVSLKPIK